MREQERAELAARERAHSPLQERPLIFREFGPERSYDQSLKELEEKYSPPAFQPPPPGASTRELFEHMCAAMETGDDKVFKQAIATVADSPSNREFWAHISASVDADQREAQLQAQMQEQAQQLQRMERQGPVMSLGFSR